MARIEAIALSANMDSFAHLNEKKILRKMDLRLIPMLAALYLLSFLDRKFATIRDIALLFGRCCPVSSNTVQHLNNITD